MYVAPFFRGTRVPVQTRWKYSRSLPTISRELAMQALEAAEYLFARAHLIAATLDKRVDER